MTDKEMFLHLIGKLIIEVRDEDLSIYNKGYSINNKKIIISDGQGNSHSCIVFYFDDQDNFINYGIEEGAI